jgi:hypothetical protein
MAGFLLCAASGLAQPSPGKPPPSYLDSWSFYDSKNWTSDTGYLPVSFTNLAFSNLGNGASLVVDTNVSAWLQYNVVENDEATNLTINSGSVVFWYAPASWSSTNAGGTGPSEWAQLIDVGEWTPDASSGYWGLAIDPPGTNLWFQTQDGSGNSYSLSAPISWTTNYFHFIVLTYSSTNVSLYLDGQLATNDSGGLSVWPGSAALVNGFFIGSDTNGLYQAHGLFNYVVTYDAPLDSNTIQDTYESESSLYVINPFNVAMNLSSAPSSPSTNANPDVITGSGYLQINGPVSAQVYGANANQVWITNVTAVAVSNGTTSVSFTIEGGFDGAMYDVFATAALTSPITNGVWYWMGQGGHFTNYTLTITSTDTLIILGTPQDTAGSGLTDAYQYLITHTDPTIPDSDPDGILTGWEVLLGLNPQMNNANNASERAGYGYTASDWLDSVSGVKSGTIHTDPEGNVTLVSQ